MQCSLENFVCSKFGGGGRETAGGIDLLPKEMMLELMNEVNLRRHN